MEFSNVTFPFVSVAMTPSPMLASVVRKSSPLLVDRGGRLAQRLQVRSQQPQEGNDGDKSQHDRQHAAGKCRMVRAIAHCLAGDVQFPLVVLHLVEEGADRIHRPFAAVEDRNLAGLIDARFF